jgi:signal peptidase I
LISLWIFISVVLASLFLEAWALALAARIVGSARGRLRWGMVAALLGTTTGLALAPTHRLLAKTGALPIWAVILLVVALQWVVAFVILRLVFRLSSLRTLVPLGAIIAVCVALVFVSLLVIKPYVVEAFGVQPATMSPTMESGDYVCAEKLIHPRRWDLIVCWSDGFNGIRAPYCRRLVGLPGERIRFDAGMIYINDQPVDMPSVLAGRCHAYAGGRPGRGLYRDGQTITLGANQIFVIGDNVDETADSRYYGPSDRSSIIGVIDLIYWPINRMRIVR